MPRYTFAVLTVSLVALWQTSALGAATRTIIVRAAACDYPEVPVSVSVTPPTGADGATVTLAGRPVPSQAVRDGRKLSVTWIVRDLRRGQSRPYQLVFGKAARTQSRIVLRPARGAGESVGRGADMEILVGGELFTRYDTTTGPNKPFFLPVYGPGQKLMVRGYPVAPREGETSDHPHQRGLWFTHGAVNGDDFWSNSPSKTVHTGFTGVVSGPVYGAFTAHTDWVAKSGATIARDRREVKVYELGGVRVLDLRITITPVGGPLVLGDTKEGSFGLRLPDSMRLKGGDGHIRNSEGLMDGATWGKRADWVDYYGTVAGATMGVAILNGRESFRSPTWWHVRDYGLFAANPFGLHDFDTTQPAGAGEHTVPLSGSMLLTYRVLFHRGTTDDAKIADWWAAFATPPHVTVR